nr:ABC transporter permease subunit [Micromonospora sp. DSM 115978]
MTVRALRAELFALRRRPAVWVLAAAWTGQIICFVYLITYLVYRALPAGPDAGRVLVDLLPSSADRTVVGALPVWGGPVMLILGALIAGGDQRWGTPRTVLARFADRTAFLLGRFLALAVVLLALAASTLLVAAASSAAVALVEGEALRWPGPGRFALALGSIWLIGTAWAAVGFVLALTLRNLAAAIGVGLLWTLLVENAVNGLGGLVPLFGALRTAQLSTGSGSMAAALGASGDGFGVAAVTSGPVAAAVLGGYVAVALFTALAVFRRRDLA